jgi:hypothetical protein
VSKRWRGIEFAWTGSALLMVNLKLAAIGHVIGKAGKRDRVMVAVHATSTSCSLLICCAFESFLESYTSCGAN